jgi:hypothetical protein
MLIYYVTISNCTHSTMRVHTPALKQKKQYDLKHDELDLEKLMQYYRFEKREQLLDFLKAQCIQ